MNPIIRFALGMANMPDAEVADLDKSFPALARITAAAKEAEPILSQMAPLVEKLWPILLKIYPDIVLVTPTVGEIIEFVNDKAKGG